MSQKRGTGGAAERIRARLANELAPEQPTAEQSQLDTAEVTARQHFLGSIVQITSGRSVEHMPVGHIAPDLRPEMRQPRMLPLPEEIAGIDPPTIYRELLAELRALGQSLRERQIQPIIVYPGASVDYPAARYLILVGQRRWTAAVIGGMEFLDAVVVEPPAPAERVRLQYRENEEREDFSDMERAWAILQLRAAVGEDEVSIDAVAAQLGIKRARAYQLRRLLALGPMQQRRVALLRLQETQLRTMLDAFHRGQIDAGQVDLILDRLTAIAADRAHQAEAQADQASATQTRGPRQLGIDAPTVARLVAHTIGAPLGASPDDGANVSANRWCAQLRTVLAQATDSLLQIDGWAQGLGQSELNAVQSDLRQLQAALDHAATLLAKSDDSNQG
jgi:ParB/RepB/Spo0J family partition protein